MPTIKDVAREAGVSTATVSRYLHNSPNVLPETRELIEAAIRKLDYHPNYLARQFRTQKTGNILVIVPTIENTFYHRIISSIEEEAEKKGYYVTIANAHGRVDLEEYYYECLVRKQVDGIITFSDRLPGEKLSHLANQYPIVVAVRYYKGIQLPNVAIDNEKASRDITRYLLNLGHRQICYFTGPTDILLYQDRLNGYMSAMAERGITVDESMIIHDVSSIQDGYDAVCRLLSSGTKFSAIVTAGDTMAIGAIQALKANRVKVPRDVAVTGFDDIELSSLYSPALTTVRQPRKLIGVRATEKLLDLIEGRKSGIQSDLLNYELVIRESSGDFLG